MKIRFRHVGCIQELDFELKHGLTLFCGPNSTGKTYAAYTIFSILSHLKKTRFDWLTENDLAQLFATGIFTLDLKKIVESQNFLDDVSRKLARHLSGDFDAPKGFFDENCIRIDDLHPAQAGGTSGKPVLSGAHSKNIDVSLDAGSGNITIALLAFPDGKTLEQLPTARVIQLVNELISHLFANYYFGLVQVLSAERAAVNLFSRELSAARSDLVDQLLALDEEGGADEALALSDLVGQKATRYSLPIRKGLAIAEDLKNITKQQSHFAPWAEKLENVILGGKLEVGEYGELIFQHNASTNLRINLAASMVKSLASLVVYLRHQASKGDLLIIDEPELNLHPASQRKLARFLCELSNAGLDVLISTHSDYIVREVNNAILLRHPSMQSVKQRFGYTDEQLIAPEKVSVVLFNTAGRPTQLTVDYKGFAVDSIDDEIDLLNRIADDIEQEWQE